MESDFKAAFVEVLKQRLIKLKKYELMLSQTTSN